MAQIPVENREPGVIYRKLPSPKQILIPAQVAEVAFVGKSKTTKTLTDEEVTRGSGTTDDLSADTVSSITSIYDKNGVKYFLTADFILTAPNKVDWTPAGNEPAVGVKYYATYEIPRDPALGDYNFKTFYSQDDVIQEYGESSSTNELSLATELFFLNGGVKIHTVQIDGIDSAAFLEAFDKLAAEELDIIVPLQSNSTGFETIFLDIKGRIFQLSQPVEGMQRMAFLAPVIGTSIADYKTLAQGLKFERLALIAPSSVNKTIDSVLYELPAYFFGAAASGFLADPDNLVSDPLTRKELYGFDSINVKYTKTQIRELIQNGIMIVEDFNGLIRVVQGITTDRTGVDTNEISLVRVADFFGKTLRTTLDQIYVGTRLDLTSLASIRTTITTVCDNFISRGIFTNIADLSVKQNTQNPTAVDVFLNIQPVYPLNYITVEFTLALL